MILCAEDKHFSVSTRVTVTKAFSACPDCSATLERQSTSAKGARLRLCSRASQYSVFVALALQNRRVDGDGFFQSLHCRRDVRYDWRHAVMEPFGGCLQ